jgi:SNF2 family DNA or RNA helicase
MLDGFTQEERDQYWNTQSSLSTVSAATPTYGEACEMFCWDRSHPTPFPDLWHDRQAQKELAEQPEQDAAAQQNAEEHRGERPASAVLAQLPDVLVLNPWQVTGVAWAFQQESLPIRGGMIADDCGTGKTITMLTVILQRFRIARRDFEAGAIGPWKPTIIICPPHVVDVWFDEVMKFFSSELLVYRFYETKAKVTHPIFKAQTLPSSAKHLVGWLNENCKEDDPQSAGKVVVTAYDTWAFRTLMKRAGGSIPGRPADYSLSHSPPDYSLLPQPATC